MQFSLYLPTNKIFQMLWMPQKSQTSLVFILFVNATGIEMHFCYVCCLLPAAIFIE